MNAKHSPLPPEPPPTIELLSAQMIRAITVIEVMASRVESMDERWEHRIDRLTERERALSSLARKLSSAALTMSMARILPKARWLVATSLGAFVGGVVGSMVWQWLYAASALAHP